MPNLLALVRKASFWRVLTSLEPCVRNGSTMTGQNPSGRIHPVYQTRRMISKGNTKLELLRVSIFCSLGAGIEQSVHS